VVSGFQTAYGPDQGYRIKHHGAKVMDPAGFGGQALTIAIDAANPDVSVINTPDLKVRAILVDHGPVEPALGYVFEYKGRKVVISGDTKPSARLEAAGRGLLADGLAGMITPSALASVGLDASPPRVWRGGIATGDQFVCDAGTRAAIKRRIPGALAVEMEGAAVAQVCADEGVPLAAVRVISDSADAHAPASFATFVEQVAEVMLVEIVRPGTGERQAHPTLSTEALLQLRPADKWPAVGCWLGRSWLPAARRRAARNRTPRRSRLPPAAAAAAQLLIFNFSTFVI
jgi:hypothetical protein